MSITKSDMAIDSITVATPATKDTPDRCRLHGQMGTLQLVFTVLAFNAPVGVVAGVVPLVIAFGSGVATPMVLLGLALLMALFAVGYTAMARVIPYAGGLYTFTTAGLGKPLGLAACFLALLSYTAGFLGTIPFLGITIRELLASVGLDGLPWYVPAAVFAVVISFLGYRRIDLSTKVLGVVVILEIAIVLAYDFFVMKHGGASGTLTYESFDPAVLKSGGIAVGIMIAFLSFSGFEVTAVFRDEVKDPALTVPRATYATLGILGVLYSVTAWLIIQAYGPNEAQAIIGANPGVAFKDSVTQYVGVVGGHIATVLVVTSVFATLLSLHNVIARYLFSLSVDEVIPGIGQAHAEHGSPHRASVVFSIITFGFLIISGLSGVSADVIFGTLIGLAGYPLIALMTLTALGIAFYQMRRSSSDGSLWQRVIAPVFAVVLMAAALTMVTMNIETFTGSATLANLSLSLTAGAAVLAIVSALIIRSRNPEAYRRIATRD
ncbi:Putrescine importer PuuP [Pseudomonas fluorescens]|uniref:Putrescine importer PuuP n=1 Tax=Pseudomonas fluorescens TaxID=294 RepID=A0A5E6XX06_PSEFL|nr:APC family permease [Pseudomonas fluorescens]VVN46098.1 Putrescine importer PuuP [Pseudomonas fluorescens]